MAGDGQAVPRTLDDLTPDWLTGALAAAGFAGATVRDVALTPLAVGEGFMGTLARVVPEYATAPADAPRSLVAKLPTTDPGGVALAMLLRLWERESRFYAEVAPHLPVRTPRCFYSGSDTESGAFALLLEDLAGLSLGDQVAGLGRHQAELAVDWLARFHAAWWGRDDLDRLAWMPRVATDPMYEGLQPMLEAVWPGFVERYGSLAPAETLEWIERVIPRFHELLAARDLPETVIHADYRPDNLFFDEDGDDVAVIDWQATAVAQGLYDLAYFLGTGMRVDDRRHGERELVERYRQGLAAAGVDDLPQPEPMFDLYRKNVLTATGIVAMLVGQLDLEVNERGTSLARNNVERMFHAAADLRVGGLLDA